MALLLTLVVAVPLVWAQNTMPTIPKPDLLPGPQEGTSANETQLFFRNKAVPSFISGFISMIGGLSLIVIVWAGIRFITSGGTEEVITEAKKTATFAAIGFGIALLSYALVSIVSSLNFPDETQTNQPTQEDVIYNRN